jgi:cytidylate kinase
MSDLALEKCHTFIETQFKPATAGERAPGERPLVTISRETGAGGTTLAEALAGYLNARVPKKAVRWTVFDKNLIEKVLEEHDLPARLAELLPEDRHSAVVDAVEELLGLHPSAWRIVQETTETIRHLAEVGNVILVGRGSHVITEALPYAVHVKVVASVESRAARMRELLGLSRPKALEHVRKTDAARARYLKRYFKRDVDNVHDYHLVINTDRVGAEEAARMVGDLVLSRKG